MTIKTAYEVIIFYHLHMPSYFLGEFTECPYIDIADDVKANAMSKFNQL